MVLLPEQVEYPAINVDGESIHFVTAGNKGMFVENSKPTLTYWGDRHITFKYHQMMISEDSRFCLCLVMDRFDLHLDIEHL